MNYTKNYRLPQWVKEDRIMMDDFNQMNDSIETGLTKTAAEAASAVSTANAASRTADAAMAYSYMVGTYTGNDSEEWRTIHVGFKPSFLIISGQSVGSYPNSPAVVRFCATGERSTTSSLVRFTSTGFEVHKDSTYPYPELNCSTRYTFIAFR